MKYKTNTFRLTMFSLLPAYSYFSHILYANLTGDQRYIQKLDYLFLF